MKEALRRTAVMALAETRRGALQMDRKTLLTLAALSLVTLLLAPALMERGLDFEHGLYRVEVASNHQLFPAIAGDPRFIVVPPELNRLGTSADAVVAGNRIFPVDTPKGHAAAEAIAETAEQYGIALMLLEPDQGAAFPVRVEVRYEDQAVPSQSSGLALPNPEQTPADAGQPAPEPETEAEPDGGGAVKDSQEPLPPVEVGESDSFSFLPAKTDLKVPSTLSPPFPFQSLILAYVFLIPMNFIVQGYASSMMGERLQRKGEALLASPARPVEIVAGKTLPYALAMLLCAGLTAFFVGGGVWALVAMLPVVAAFLALEFCAAAFARSFRELTFLTVFVSVSLTIYCFLPAVFTDIHPVALISPITLVVLALRGEPIGLIDVTFSITPLLLVSFVSFYLGLRLWSEEDLFHQKPVKSKIVDALAKPVTRPLSALKMSMLLIPFVFVAQLLLVTGAVAWGVTTSIFLILVLAASVEEVGKSAAVAAAYSRDRLKTTLGTALLAGAAAGVGFFVAEKIVFLASLVGLLHLNAGAAVFAAPTLPLPVWVLFLLPLALHVVTAMITALAASRGRAAYGMGLVTATLVHALYNYAVMRYSLGASL